MFKVSLPARLIYTVANSSGVKPSMRHFPFGLLTAAGTYRQILPLILVLTTLGSPASATTLLGMTIDE
ncbi:MAG: hypothetical protein WD772_04435, partial [Pseudohongiellaceae bacterium]